MHLHMLSLGDVDVMCKGEKPASVSDMQYACTPELKCTYLNPNPKPQTLNPKLFQWIGLSTLSFLVAILLLGVSGTLSNMQWHQNKLK